MAGGPRPRHIRAMRPDTRGTLAIVGSSLGYGALAVLAKLAFDAGVGVLPLLTWRFVVGSALVWAFVLLAGRPVPLGRRATGVVLLGTLYAGNSLAFMVGLERIPASLASLVFFTYPAVTVVMARFRGGEPLTRRRLICLGLATAGCALTVGQGTSGVDLDPLGVAWVLVGVLLISTFIVASHGVLARVPPLGGTAVLLTTTAAVLGLAALLTSGVGVPLEPRPLLLLAALGALSTAVPVTLFLLGIQWIGPGRAAILSTMEPVVTVFLATIVLDEILSPRQLLGGALILAGVIWLRLERGPPAAEPHAP